MGREANVTLHVKIQGKKELHVYEVPFSEWEDAFQNIKDVEPMAEVTFGVIQGGKK